MREVMRSEREVISTEVKKLAPCGNLRAHVAITHAALVIELRQGPISEALQHLDSSRII